MSQYLFVYGTLRRAFDNYYSNLLKEEGIWKGKTSINGKLFNYKWYPVAIFEPLSKRSIIGEVYHLNNPAILNMLDEYEGISNDIAANEYERILIHVSLEGQTIPCWFYQFKGSSQYLSIIESGDFLNP